MIINDRCAGLLKGSKIIPSSISQMLLDKFYPIIHVDRTIYPVYPDWMSEIKKNLHPELELKGPDRFDVTKLERWLHPDQKRGYFIGSRQLYDELIVLDLLKYCINLADSLAIQKRGVKFFRRYFPEGIVPAWSSTVQYYSGGLRVPCLVEWNNEIS